MEEHRDLRLLPAALGCWGAAAVSLQSAAVAWMTTVALAVVAAGCLLLRRRGGPDRHEVRAVCVALAAAAGIAAGVAVSVAVRVHDRERATIAEFDGRGSVEVVFEVNEWPRQRASAQGHRDTSRSLVPGSAVAIAGGGDRPRGVRGGVVVLGATIDVGDLVPGQRVLVRARVVRSTRPGLVAAVVVSTGKPHVLTGSSRSRVHDLVQV